MSEKPITWLGSSLSDLRAFPAEARQDAGYALDRIQQGLAPPDWKPMPDIGAGAYEVRVHANGEFRIFYVAKFAEAVYVLHAFQKKAQQTTQRDMDLGRRRYASLLEMRR